MSEHQIKEYLQKYKITSKEQLAKHIEELKKNTVPNVGLISELVTVLEDSFFSFLPAENKDKLTKIIDNAVDRYESKSKLNKIKNDLIYTQQYDLGTILKIFNAETEEEIKKIFAEKELKTEEIITDSQQERISSLFLDEITEKLMTTPHKSNDNLLEQWVTNMTGKIPEEKTETEFLIFTLLEEETLSESDRKGLSTRHKSRQGETHNCSYTKCGQKECNCCYPNKQQQEKKVIADWERKEYPLGGFPKREKIIDYSKIGEKTNKNKPQISLLFTQFPKALEAIVKCSQYGHSKYKETDTDYLNYTRVEEGSKAYADASLRHRLQQGNDLESGLPHQFHVAWNALAELELWIKENNKNG